MTAELDVREDNACQRAPKGYMAQIYVRAVIDVHPASATAVPFFIEKIQRPPEHEDITS